MKKITQKEIAKVLGVQQPAVSRYINGISKLSVKDALLLKEKLGIPCEAWLDIKKYLKERG